MRRFGPRALWGAAALTLIAMACTKEEQAVKEVPVEVVQPAGSLVVYSGRSESLVGPIIKQFRDVTGIDVSVKYGSTPEVASDASLGALRQRLETLLPALEAPADSKLSQWVFQRLPMLSERDVGFVHTLCGNLERKL